jgi:ANTAR domain-containing protein
MMRQQLTSTAVPLPPAWTLRDLRQLESFRPDDSIEERTILSAANAALRSALHLTEEEAYARLHETSRRTRKRLIVMAKEILDASQDTSLDETTLGFIVRRKLSA